MQKSSYNGWENLFITEFTKPYFVNLKQFLLNEYATKTVYPPKAVDTQRIRPHGVRQRKGGHPRARPLLQSGASNGDEFFRARRCCCAKKFAKYV